MQWWYERAGESVGPFSSGEMSALLRNGTINQLTLVFGQRPDGSSLDWLEFAHSPLAHPTPNPPSSLVSGIKEKLASHGISPWLVIGGIFLLAVTIAANIFGPRSDSSPVTVQAGSEGCAQCGSWVASFVVITSKVDDVTIKDVTINRGQCSKSGVMWTDSDIRNTHLKFGEVIRKTYGSNLDGLSGKVCILAEVKVDTDRGEYVFSFDQKSP